jgi:hypothetical protein
MSTDRIHTQTSGVPSFTPPAEGVLAYDPATGVLYINRDGTLSGWGVGIGVPTTTTFTNDEAFTITAGEGVVIASTGANRVEVAEKTDSKRLIGIAAEDVLAGASGEFYTLQGMRVTVQLNTGLTPASGDLVVIDAGGVFDPTATTAPGEFVKGGVLLTDVSAYIGGIPANSLADGIFLSDRPYEVA